MRLLFETRFEALIGAYAALPPAIASLLDRRQA